MKEIFIVLGRGIGQVMLQNNALSGLLMLAGIMANSWQMALLAVTGNVVSTLTAYGLGYSREDIRNGLYGFNGTLVGIAVGVFMPITAVSMLLLTAGAAVSTLIARLFARQHRLPGFTAPFILSVWGLLAMCSLLMPNLLLPAGEMATAQQPEVFRGVCLGIGQVMFQGDTIWAGLLFWAGILANSRLHAVYAVAGALLPILLVLPLTTDYGAVNMGLMGYNGVLCAIALGDRNWKGSARAMAAVLLSVILQMVGMYGGITTLTAPFVVATWCFRQKDRV